MISNTRDISIWVLAHTQLAQALEEAWLQFCIFKGQIDVQEIRENEKHIGDVVEEVWEENLLLMKQNENCKIAQIEGEEPARNNVFIDPSLGSNVIKQRFTVKDCSVDQRIFNNMDIVALDISQQQQQNKPNKKKKK